MDDFRLGPISPYDSYRDHPPSNSGDRKKAKRPKDRTAGEDEVILAQSGAADPQADDSAGMEDYTRPRMGAKYRSDSWPRAGRARPLQGALWL